MDIEVDEVMIKKASIIERSLKRVLEEYNSDPELTSYTVQDALLLNLERACQGAIDLAMHVVMKNRLGIPENSADCFRILEKNDVLTKESAKSMVGMTGFRNIAVHEYQKLSMEVVHWIAGSGWESLVAFCNELGLLVDVSQ